MKMEVPVLRESIVLSEALLCALFFAVAPASSAPPAVAAPAEGASSVVKSSTTSVPTPADSMVSPDKPTAAETRLAAFCRGDGFAFAAFFADRKAVHEVVSSTIDELSIVEEYAACRDLAGAPQACRTLVRAAPEHSGGRACGVMAWEARLARAVIAGGDAAGVCRSSPEAGSLSPQALDRVCAAYVAGARTGRPEAFCSELAKSGAAVDLDDCRKEQSFWKGGAADCSGLPKDIAGECRALAGYVAGLRDRAVCKSSRLCSGSCADYSQVLSRGFCASIGAKMAKWSKFESKRREIAAEYFREKRAKEAAAKRHFKKGQPMQFGDATLRENIKRIEKGLPPIDAPKKAPPADGGGSAPEGGNGQN